MDGWKSSKFKNNQVIASLFFFGYGLKYFHSELKRVHNMYAAVCTFIKILFLHNTFCNMSLSVIPNLIPKKYSKLVIHKKDTKISPSILCTIWEKVALKRLCQQVAYSCIGSHDFFFLFPFCDTDLLTVIILWWDTQCS